MLTHRLNTGLFVTVIIVLGVLVFFYPLPWWLFLVPGFVWLVAAVAGSGLIRSGYHLKALSSNRSITAKQLAITFDDGPTPETEKVIALLKQYNAKATFFCIGTQIEKYPHILQKLVDEGHTIGNHTYSHSPQMGLFPTTKVINELEVTNALIERHTAKKALLFRPPYGVTNPAIARAIKKTGHYVIGWNVRSLDGILKSEASILARVKKGIAPGNIILLHDTSQKSVNVLEQLLLLLQQQQYTAVTVDQLLNIPAYEE